MNTTLSTGNSRAILLVHAMNPVKKFVLRKIKKMGLTIVCLHPEKAPWAIPYVDFWITADLNDHQSCIQAIKTFQADHQKIKVLGAVTFWDEAVLLTSRLIDTFNFIGIPFNVANRTKNKYLFRDFCNNNAIPAPHHRLLKSKRDINYLDQYLRFPLIIKPIYGACSAYVVKANNRQELLENYDYIKNNIKSFWLAAEWENLELLVEEYIDGEEVDIDILMQNGKNKFFSISDNFNKNRDRFFVDSGQAIPSSLPTQNQAALIAMAEETLEKLGITDGCIHFEAKITKNGPVPIEVNLRMGGDYVYSYIKNAWKVDLVEEAVHIALGTYIKIEKPPIPYQYIVGWDLQPDFSGILVELDIAPELKDKSFLQEIHFFKEIGDPLLRPPEGYDSLGWLTVSGDNLLDAQDNLRQALDLIHYKVVQFDAESALGKTDRTNRLSVAVVKKELLIQAAKIEKIRRFVERDQRDLHIGIVGSSYQGSGLEETIATELTLATQTIADELGRRGYRVSFFDVSNLMTAFNQLRRSDIDFVFNAYEPVNLTMPTKYQIAAMLEAAHIPFTGSSSIDLALCQDKIRFKKLLSYHNIPIPKWDYAYTLNDIINPELRFPLIVKPAVADNSVGITNKSVVTDHQQLKHQIKQVIVGMRCPALVEEYIAGDEYTVSILGTDQETIRVLPLTRSHFSKLPKSYWHIYSYEARWSQRKNSIYNKITVQHAPKKVGPKLEKLITEIALDTYMILHCRDYGRVEIRVDKDDNPYVLEIDPHPLLANKSSFTQVAKLMKMSYGDVLEEILNSALKYYQKNQH